MGNNVSEGPWLSSLRAREVGARSMRILYRQRYDDSCLEEARARIASLMGGVHGPKFARSLAWDLSDPMDLEFVQVAAKEMGEEEVMEAILSQADPASYTRAGKHVGMNGWVIPAGGTVLADLLIIQRVVRSPHLEKDTGSPYRLLRVYGDESEAS